MRMSRGAGAVVAGWALAALLLPALPAAAAPATHLDGLEFSRDGMTWSAEPPEVLFDEGFVDTPGEQRSATVLVRNTRASNVRIATALSGVAWSHPSAGTAFRLTSSDQYGQGIDDTPIGSIARCTPLLPTRIIGAGDVLSIAVTVTLDVSARGTPAESASVRFDLLIALGAYPGPSPASACSESTHSENERGPNAHLGIVAIASLPNELLPGTILDSSDDGTLVAPTLAVALGAGLAGLVLYVLLRLRRRAAEADGSAEVDAGVDAAAASAKGEPA